MLKKKQILGAVLAVTMMGCASGPKMQSKDISGTFNGTAKGMQGKVKVAVTLGKGEIKKVEIVDAKETMSIAKVAFDRLPNQIVEHQTTDLDTVTGATFASRAILSATNKALEAAGANKDILKANAYHAKAGKAETKDTDVLVIGGGGAGLSAAIRAGESGAKVILIEKSSFLGGDTMMAGGAFNAVDTEAQKSKILTVAEKKTLDDYLNLDEADAKFHFDQFPEWKEVLTSLKKDIQSFYTQNAGRTAGTDMPGFDSTNLHMWHIYTGGLRQMNDGKWVAPQIALAKKLTSTALEAYDWAGSLGVKTESGAGKGKSLYTVLGAMWARTHQYDNGEPLINALKAAAEKNHVEILTETAGTELIMKDGKVVGAKAKKADGTEITFNASKGVVLASGGYCANPKMVKEYDNYWGADLKDTTPTTNVGTVTGDGIKMAQAIGAGTVDLGVAQLMPSSSPLKGTMTDGFWTDASEQLWMDGNGNRFVNEYAERDVLAKASLKLENGIFYIVSAGSSMKSPTGKAEGVSLDTPFMHGATIQDMVEGGHVWYGSTLKELAEATQKSAGGSKAHFTEEQLRNLIEKYNSYVQNQNDPDFHKENLQGYIDLEAIEKDPTKGIVVSPRKASLHHTMGGLTINDQAQVLDKDGKEIAGLFAAGEVTGGVHGGNRLGGNAIADIFTFGRIAGENVSK